MKFIMSMWKYVLANSPAQDILDISYYHIHIWLYRCESMWGRAAPAQNFPPSPGRSRCLHLPPSPQQPLKYNVYRYFIKCYIILWYDKVSANTASSFPQVAKNLTGHRMHVVGPQMHQYIFFIGCNMYSKKCVAQNLILNPFFDNYTNHTVQNL